MRGGDHSYPAVQLAVWNIIKEKLHQIYFSATYLTLLHPQLNQLPVKPSRLPRGNTLPV